MIMNRESACCVFLRPAVQTHPLPRVTRNIIRGEHGVDAHDCFAVCHLSMNLSSDQVKGKLNQLIAVCNKRDSTWCFVRIGLDATKSPEYTCEWSSIVLISFTGGKLGTYLLYHNDLIFENLVLGSVCGVFLHFFSLSVKLLPKFCHFLFFFSARINVTVLRLTLICCILCSSRVPWGWQEAASPWCLVRCHQKQKTQNMAEDPWAYYAQVSGALCGSPQEPSGKGRSLSVQEYLPAGTCKGWWKRPGGCLQWGGQNFCWCF